MTRKTFRRLTIHGFAITLIVMVGLTTATDVLAAAPIPGIFSAARTRLQSLPTVAPGSSLALGDVDADGTDELVVGSPPGVRASVTTYEMDGTRIRVFYPYGSATFGVNVAAGDITGSGFVKIVTAPRRGAAPHVLIFNGEGRKFNLGFFAYAEGFRGGVNVTLGDVNGDGVKDILTAAAPGGGPHVRFFRPEGLAIGSFFARESAFRGGISISSFDYNLDGVDDVVTAPQTRSVADVSITSPIDYSLLKKFRALGSFGGGVAVSVNHLSSPKKIVVGAAAGGGGQVVQYDPATGGISGLSFFPFGTSWRGGVVPLPLDSTGDDVAEFFVSPGALTLSAAELSAYSASYTTSTTTGASYEKRNVATSVGTFAVHVVKADLTTANLKIKTVTATTGDCSDNCPVHPLQYYVDQAGGFAGLNGSYFCPKDYSGCASQDGSTYWMWFNSLTQTFVNAYQNRFNTGPLLAFDTKNKMYLYDQSKNFGDRATFESTHNVTLRALLSNAPLLVKNGNYVVNNGQLDTKQLTVKSNRSGIGLRGNTLYLFVASGATVPDLGRVADALGLDTAVNLDGGGSSAMTFNGAYRIGPGRNIPNAVVLTFK